MVHSMVEPMAILTFFEIVYFTLKTRRYVRVRVRVSRLLHPQDAQVRRKK